MDENNSPAPVEDTSADTPAPDSVMDVFDDTDDSPTVTPKEDTPAADETTEQPETESDQEAEAEPEAENQPEGDEELQPESDPKEEARRRYEERQAFRQQQQSEIRQRSQSYINEGEDEYEQRMRAIEANEYARTVEQTQDKIIGEFERVKANPDLQIFNPESDQFNERAYAKAIKDYNSGYVEYDNNGYMVGIKGSLFEHLTETADLLKDSVKSGQVQQVRATRNMRNKADTKPAATPKEQPKDIIAEVWAD